MKLYLKIRKRLLDKLKISPQALSQRIQRMRKISPITNEEGIYIIAHKEGIRLDKYLDKETISHIRNLIQSTFNDGVVEFKSTPSKSKIKKVVAKRTIVIAKEFEGSDPILPDCKLNEAKDMAGLYPLLYVLENSIRELIDRMMISKFGVDWWIAEAPKKLKDKVSDRMSSDKKNSWHQRRGARYIDYLDLNELPAILRKIEKSIVPNILPTFEWFNQLVDEVYKSRCVLCHMNPLDKDNSDALRLRFRQWQKQISEKKSMI